MVSQGSVTNQFSNRVAWTGNIQAQCFRRRSTAKKNLEAKREPARRYVYLHPTDTRSFLTSSEFSKSRQV